MTEIRKKLRIYGWILCGFPCFKWLFITCFIFYSVDMERLPREWGRKI